MHCNDLSCGSRFPILHFKVGDKNQFSYARIGMCALSRFNKKGLQDKGKHYYVYFKKE